jgi:hypothetical protein
VSYNEYPLRKDGFNGAQVLVMSKAKLVAGHLSPVLRITAGTIGGGLLYSMQPAQVPPGGSYNTGRNGTLFFTSAADFDGAGDTRVLMEALTNTAAINTNPLNIHVKKAQHSSLGYISPLKIEQKDGPNPLGDSLGEDVNLLDGGGDETQPTTLAAGYVWTAIDTRIIGDRSGILWLQFHPSFSSTGALRFGVTHQGYVAVSGENVTYGAIAVTPAGKVLIAMSLVSSDRFPSTGYAFITPSTGVGAIHVASAGTEAEDGFTCYVAFLGPGATDRGCRWGDYSGAEVGTDGRFYFGAEDQSLVSPDAPFANWETSISRVNAPT